MIVKIPERPRNPDFPRPFFPLWAPVDHSKEVSNPGPAPTSFNKFNSAPQKEFRCTVIKFRLSGHVVAVAIGDINDDALSGTSKENSISVSPL